MMYLIIRIALTKEKLFMNQKIKNLLKKKF